MDPNLTLKNARSLAANILRGLDSDEDISEAIYDWAQELSESFQALDDWMNKGGFLPTDWQATEI